MEITPGRQREPGRREDDAHRAGLRHGRVHRLRRALKLLALPGVTEANVDLVWDPPWNPQMISPEGKERLGMA